ncbi:sulfotransferase [Aliiroseovarius sp. KMU-50]|uniref:Sulfotransferase n=1 Tax=Aliiroseovarius salicola TaxID=3009082 RepID=A0ABT4W356_9RHOB|nr:tetratricopeptide repeat-containing sulfotransferase family protein [Aliiroseovarius sp. KMU-50]MDA5094942.1 sulfotransferase [Aliiroseovarius sp. KMU-50]
MSKNNSRPPSSKASPMFPLASQTARPAPLGSSKPGLAQAQKAVNTGQAAMGHGRFKDAANAFHEAARLMPRDPQIWTVYAKSLSMLGDKAAVKRAQKLMKKLGIPAPTQKKLLAQMTRSNTQTSRQSIGIPSSTINQLLARFNSGEAEAVSKESDALAKDNPKNEVIRLILGASLASLGQVDRAEQAYQEALALAPDYAEVMTNYAELLIKQRRFNEAYDLLREAYRQIPSNSNVRGNLGHVLKELSRPHEAVPHFDAVLKVDPSNRLARLLRVDCLITLERHEEALDDFEAMPEELRNQSEQMAMRSVALDQAGRSEEGLALARKAFEKAPTVTRVATMTANLLQQHGKFEEAETLLRNAIGKGLKSGTVYRQISSGRKIQLDDPVALDMISLWENEPEFPGRADLGYALVKLMEDNKQFDKVWPYLEAANASALRDFPNTKGRDQNEFDKMVRFVGGMDMSRIGSVGYQDDSPIFITGMPRSGTTLVEQILASHSRVTGGDEMALFHTIGFDHANKVLAEGGSINDVNAQMLDEIGKEYREAVLKRFPEADIVTDKSISTYKVAPLVWLALPKAKIVALRRDPRDNLFSMLKNRFVAGAHTYTYDQADLVEVYRLFTEYLAEWRKIAADRIYEIQYEDLVADPETQVRKLLEFCELEWEDACMSFHKNTRKVKTLSIHQARQPLYNSSIGRWRQYEDKLGVMLDGLKGLDGVPED